MSESPSLSSSNNQGDVNIPGSIHLEGQAALAIGAGAILNVNQVPPEVQQLLEEVRRLTNELRKQGIGADIAPVASPLSTLAQASNAPEHDSLRFLDPSASAFGARFPGRTPAAQELEQLTYRSTRIDDILKQVDQHLGQPGQSVGAIDFPQQRLPLVEIRLQQGNLALWQFRRASARLFGEGITAEIRARASWPHPPEMDALCIQATTNLEVLRGLALLRMVAFQRSDLLLAAANQLSQGRWREVLDGWIAVGQLPEENARRVRTQIESIGEVYRPAEVQQAVQEAEAHFSEALRLHPQHTAALVNLATLLAESATFTYLATGQADRPRLRKAHGLFQQARDLLARRSERESKVALGKCLLYIAATLPAEAVLETIQWAAFQARVTRSAFSQQVQQTIRWDVVQRSAAANDPSFYSAAAMQQARSLFVEVGDVLMAEHCSRSLQSLEQMRAAIPLIHQQLQAVAPVVGTWRIQVKNMLAAFQGVLIFDTDGQFYWQTEGQTMVSGGPQRIIVLGQYQVMGNILALQGSNRTIPLRFGGMPTMPMPFLEQLMIVQHTGSFLQLYSQTNGSQMQCQRL